MPVTTPFSFFHTLEYAMKSASQIVFALFTLSAISGYAAAGEPSAADAMPAVAPTAQRLVLPLDHGPRAQSTPWLNQQLRQRALHEQREQQAASSAPSAGSVPAPAEHAVHHESTGN
jgi:hypothetical protein